MTTNGKNIFSSPLEQSSAEKLLTPKAMSVVSSGPLRTLKGSETTCTLVLATSTHHIGAKGDSVLEWTISCRLRRGFGQSTPLANVPTNSPSTPAEENTSSTATLRRGSGNTKLEKQLRSHGAEQLHAGLDATLRCAQRQQQSSRGRSASSEPLRSRHSAIWVLCQAMNNL